MYDFTGIWGFIFWCGRFLKLKDLYFKRRLTAENSGGNLYAFTRHSLEIKIKPIKEASCTSDGDVVVVF